MTNAEFNALVSQDMQRLVAAAQARQAADEQMANTLTTPKGNTDELHELNELQVLGHEP